MHRAGLGGGQRLQHAGLLRARHPIDSDSDVLATGAGFGIDAFGVGKFSSIEILVNQKDGTVRKFLADVPWSIAGWIRFLSANGATVAARDFIVCGLQVKSTKEPRTQGLVRE